MREKIRTFRDDRMRLGKKIKRVCFFLPSPFTIFEEDRMRLGEKIKRVCFSALAFHYL